jgi:hypothetical protein
MEIDHDPKEKKYKRHATWADVIVYPIGFAVMFWLIRYFH